MPVQHSILIFGALAVLSTVVLGLKHVGCSEPTVGRAAKSGGSSIGRHAALAADVALGADNPSGTGVRYR